MQKIPTLFERDWDGDRSRVLDVPASGCEWVFAGEGVATRKYDGTSCLVRDGLLYKRHEVKPGRATPADFEEVDRRTDSDGGIILTGWVPVGDGPEDRWHREAFDTTCEVLDGPPEDGTYELVGPKVQRNPENFPEHVLVAHSAAERYTDVSRTFAGMRDYFQYMDLQGMPIEGLVFHHPDGRMAKIKARDFGLKRAA